MAKSVGKIIFGDKPDNILKMSGHVFLEDVEKAKIAGHAGIAAESINYRDFLKVKNSGETFYLEVDKFDDN